MGSPSLAVALNGLKELTSPTGENAIQRTIKQGGAGQVP